ncbi:MAG: hypothetical protein Q8Q09_14335 [Deltaproteobacteria bacterium]|nr:hypothetical protein [Deltaproteobacteria bacterium]
MTETMISSALLSSLIDMVSRQDLAQLERTCVEQQAEIKANFGDWTRIPPALQRDPAAMQRYANGIITVAQLFAQLLGDSSLLARLAGPAESNPIVQWEQQLGAVQQALGKRDYAIAHTTLTQALEQTRSLMGPGADRLRAVSLGLLGQTLFHMGQMAPAIRQFEAAVALCRAQQDLDGVNAYLAALFEVQRWLGQTEKAAEWADQLAQLHQTTGSGQDGFWRARAASVRAGEPLAKVFIHHDGQRVDPDLLTPGRVLQGSVRFVFERNRLDLGAVAKLVEQGRTLGAQRDYTAALACFDEASAIDPYDPEPHYLRGQTLFLMQRAGDAAKAYRRTDALGPGWYQVRSDQWLAEMVSAGEYPHEVFALLIALEGQEAPTSRAATAAKALAQWPTLAALHHAHARALAQAGDVDGAREAARRGLACVQEPDLETRLLVSLSQWSGVTERAEFLLRAVQIGANPVAKAMAQLMLASIPAH